LILGRQYTDKSLKSEYATAFLTLLQILKNTELYFRSLPASVAFDKRLTSCNGKVKFAGLYFGAEKREDREKERERESEQEQQPTGFWSGLLCRIS